jgi:hypothetical protein
MNALLTQLRSIPVANEAVRRQAVGDDKMQISVPFHQPGWAQSVRILFPISKEKSVELDRLGAEIFALCDGTRTVEQIIDLHQDRWQLSFFESRAMILQFLQHLVKHSFVVLVAPAENLRASARDPSRCADGRKVPR